ncbi:MAG: hypothetical protein IJX13_05435, partial [Clostridia bacterium]|nr:hypothetical protein [Clostridia bacterium]
ATFLIPVYGEMPSSISPDPARGNCSYLASANRKYEYSVLCDSPTLTSSENAAVYFSQAVFPASELAFQLSVEHSYGIMGLEWRWYGEDWKALSTNSTTNLSVPVDFSVGTSHILLVRGVADYDHTDSDKKCNAYVLCAVVYVDVVEPPKKEIVIDFGHGSERFVLSQGSGFTIPAREEENFIGWVGSDGSFLPNEAVIKVSEDCTYTALFADFEQLEGASLVFLENGAHLRFYAAMENEALERLNALVSDLSVSCTMKRQGSDPVTMAAVPYQQMQALGTTWQSFCASTEVITGENVADTYSASFDICFSYSDGSSFSRRAFGTASSRSASMVAAAALADSRADYSADVISGLEQVAALSQK